MKKLNKKDPIKIYDDIDEFNKDILGYSYHYNEHNFYLKNINMNNINKNYLYHLNINKLIIENCILGSMNYFESINQIHFKNMEFDFSFWSLNFKTSHFILENITNIENILFHMRVKNLEIISNIILPIDFFTHITNIVKKGEINIFTYNRIEYTKNNITNLVRKMKINKIFYD